MCSGGGVRRESHRAVSGAHADRWVWLLRLGVRSSHSRPCHPQPLGKDERFHQTLKREVPRWPLHDLADGQRRFDAWRHVYNVYNEERPHGALDGDVPARRYRPSDRRHPQTLPPLAYSRSPSVRSTSMATTRSSTLPSISPRST